MSNRHYIATTGISEIWDLDSNLLLLGPWCLTSKENMKLLENKSYEIIPSPFKPATKIKEAADYCHIIYEELLPKLSEKLNTLHNVSYPMRYWRVLLGYWLLMFTGVLYDRYRRMENAFSMSPDSYTHLIPYKCCKLAPHDTLDFIGINGKVNNDFYNLILFSLIAYNLYPERTVEIKYKGDLTFETKKGNMKRKIYRFFINSLEIFGPQVVFSDMNLLHPLDPLLLKWKVGFKKISFKEFKTQNTLSYDNISNNVREKLTLEGAADKFQTLLYKILPQAIPMCYVENYHFYRNGVKDIKNVKAAGSVGGWYFNEEFKFFAAEASYKGAKLIDFQHGGGYGVGLSLPHEKLCLEKDIFFTWGWKNQNNKTMPLPVPSLSKIANKHSCSLNNIMFVSTSFPKYQYRFETMLQPEDMFAYLNNMKIFLQSLNNEIISMMLFRPNVDGGWNIVDTIKEEYPKLPIVANGRLTDWMKKIKLVIIDHPHTSFLEALVINVPSIFYWDHDIYLMRPEAEEYFQLLREAGILYKNPESAAKKVNEIHHDSEAWWQQPKIQNARNKFCQRFALTSENWLDEWVTALKSL